MKGTTLLSLVNLVDVFLVLVAALLLAVARDPAAGARRRPGDGDPQADHRTWRDHPGRTHRALPGWALPMPDGSRAGRPGGCPRQPGLRRVIPWRSQAPG
jgi:hypothetical protein